MRTTQDYYSKTLVVYTLMYEIKTEDVYEDFSSNKEMFDFSNYSAKPRYHDDSKKLVIEKIKNETRSVATEEIFGLKPKMYSFLLDDNNKHKKTKDVNENVIAAISHNQYKDVLLNNKCLRHSMSRTKSKDHRIRTYEINNVSLSCFDDKIYIQNNGFDGLALGYYN